MADNYTIALIPDTQHLSQSDEWAAHFQAAVDYLITNAETLNLQLIAHLGDVVQTGNSTTLWNRVKPILDDLYASGIPTIATIGNHDYTGNFATRSAAHWNTYLGSSRYVAQPWFGGIKDSGQSENIYFDLELGGRPTLVFALELFPQVETMIWAQGVAEANPHHDIIIVTHSYLHIDGTLTEDGDAHSPTTYAPGGLSGADMWDDYLKDWPNLKLVVNGHHLDGNVAQLTLNRPDGSFTFGQFTNWQESTDGGEGRVVLLEINPQTGAATRTVWNSAQEAFDTTLGNEIDFALDLWEISPGSPSGWYSGLLGTGLSQPGALLASHDGDNPTGQLGTKLSRLGNLVPGWQSILDIPAPDVLLSASGVGAGAGSGTLIIQHDLVASGAGVAAGSALLSVTRILGGSGAGVGIGRSISNGPGTGLIVGTRAPLSLLREGDTFLVILPMAGLQGRSGLARVLSITERDDGPELQLQIIPFTDAGGARLLNDTGRPRYTVAVNGNLFRHVKQSG